MKKILFTLSLLFCVHTAFSQQKLKKANHLFDEMAYVDAAKAYEDYLKGKEDPGTQTIKNVADSYYYTNNFSAAQRWYTKLYEVMGSSIEDNYFNRYIQTLRAAKEYEKADDLLKKRLKEKGDVTLTDRVIKQMKYLDSVNKEPSEYTLKNLAINTPKSDFGTAFYGDKIVYSSSKDTTDVTGKLYPWNEQPYLNLYVADRNASDGSLFDDKKFLPKEQSQYHNAALTFSPDLKTVYYSVNTVKKNDRLNNDKEGTNNIEIIKGVIDGDTFSKQEGVPFNNKAYSVGQPALSADGKWLFFVSDMPGGYGDTDIYRAQVFDNGRLGDPENLGPIINTPGREMFPFINDSILYFASDGHYGLGGLDIFQSKVKGYGLDIFSEPHNLGRPVNSNRDDFAFIIDKERKYGYFSSNRDGGKGDDDIYYFTRTEKECKQLISGMVTNKKYNIAINDATVKAYDTFGDVIASVQTGTDGHYKLEVPCDAKITVEGSKPNHTTDKKDVETTKADGSEIKDINLVLSNYDDLVKKENNIEKVDINPIYFDFNKWDIREQAAKELDKVVYVMKNFPSIEIKIESHTDSRGNDKYNMELSEKRAQSTYQYIISKGIDASRIVSVKGYGETRLLNKCSNGVPCTEEEHQLNRRSEFIIVKK